MWGAQRVRLLNKQDNVYSSNKGTTRKLKKEQFYRSGDMINAFVLDECIIDFQTHENLAPSGSTKSQKTWNYHNKMGGTRTAFANEN